MESVELDKVYNPKDFEQRIYAFWEGLHVFKPGIQKGTDARRPFVIVIPPPNVTGVLHMGHGLNNVIQDILIRYHRMKGIPSLWVPGTDHAGIATQHVVEKKLKTQGKTKHDLGREAFIEETWRVKKDHHAKIVEQLKRLGASCDWDRERFTLDEGLSRAVREVFVGLFERGLVYKDNYLINWCSSCGTALSDDEVEHFEEQGAMYRIQYPLEDGSGFIEIATTRPETMLGDTAVAVHPEDERYSRLVGKLVLLPLTGRSIPVVADSYVDREFGTGMVKITPAHDQNDWEVAKRHSLPVLNILNPDGTLNGEVPEEFRGLAVKDARKAVVKELKKQELLVSEKHHPHQVGHCYRCSTMVEPYLSDQWFVKMKPLAEKALAALTEGQIQFFPKKWENTYVHWLTNIRDWCISRQLWWGHRIPAWYCGNCGGLIVSRTDPSACTHCGSESIHQDEDVLDTWFSSWLWPFSTLGWPGETEDLARFFPTTALVTAYDIIFFWVSRMIMASMEFMGQAPFRDIYIHGLVRDKQGRKMSKSLGNGIDPLEIVDEYGADALKFTLTFMAAQGQDVLIDKESFKLGSKFANKIWNAARYLLMNMGGRNIVPLETITFTEIDSWIFHRLNETVKTVTKAVASFRFNDCSQSVYEFFWNDFCDWYVEASKPKLLSGTEKEKDEAASLLLAVLEESLRLLHPFLSFITEEIYQKLPECRGPLAVMPYPEEAGSRENPEVAAKFTVLQDLIRGIRTLRSEFAIPPGSRIDAQVRTDADFAHADIFHGYKALIMQLAGLKEFRISGEPAAHDGSVPVPGAGYEARVFIRELIDLPKEIAKLEKEHKSLENLKIQTEKKLANSQFLQNAPEDIVAKEREKLAEFGSRYRRISRYLEELS
ncbi:MAG: valine--tRNA ligase [Spirochaetales bacterium]|nr:MAG: valine--tRNA ligase [Spirochaetales bacterium]